MLKGLLALLALGKATTSTLTPIEEVATVPSTEGTLPTIISELYSLYIFYPENKMGVLELTLTSQIVCQDEIRNDTSSSLTERNCSTTPLDTIFTNFANTVNSTFQHGIAWNTLGEDGFTTTNMPLLQKPSSTFPLYTCPPVSANGTIITRSWTLFQEAIVDSMTPLDLWNNRSIANVKKQAYELFEFLAMKSLYQVPEGFCLGPIKPPAKPTPYNPGDINAIIVGAVIPTSLILFLVLCIVLYEKVLAPRNSHTNSHHGTEGLELTRRQIHTHDSSSESTPNTNTEEEIIIPFPSSIRRRQSTTTYLTTTTTADPSQTVPKTPKTGGAFV